MFERMNACKATACGLALIAIAVIAWPRSVQAEEKTVRTSDGKGANAELRKNDNINHTDGGKIAEAHGELNCRFNDGLHPESKGQRNEVIALRFDLSGVDRTKISTARLELTAFRDFPTDTGGGLQVFGLKPTAAKQDWQEDGVKFSSMPGLTWDGNPKTRGLKDEDTVSLGKLTWKELPKKNATLRFDDAALAQFLQGAGNLVTIILMQDQPGNGQVRIAAKEADSLDGGNPSGKAGDFAPRLVFELGL
jgi:hypothetical protein